MWTRETLQQFVREKLSEYQFLVVSCREPYSHSIEKGQIVCKRGTGGVVTAIDPVMQACRGTWIAYGNGSADKRVSDSMGRVQVPCDNPSYTLKRIWLTKEEERGFYFGYSNDAIWPLCHMAFQRPTFKSEDWTQYENVNRKFAQTIADELDGRKAFVWIQDYHLTLLPKYLKELLGPQIITAHFWHIPWPSFEAFRICPNKTAILEGLLANDLIGFHVRYHCNNFMDTVDRLLECRIDKEKQSIVRSGSETLIRSYPIGVDFETINRLSATDEIAGMADNLRNEFSIGGNKVILGLDRIDYTKGIPERLLGVDRLLEIHPELKEKIVFVQMGEVSRIHIQKYKDLNDEVNRIVEEVNWKYSTDTWKPVILVRRHLNLKEVLAFYKFSEICVVSSLHDGMNLVVKEFVASRFDESGSVVLSQFTGAARELTEAILVNPYDRDQIADGIYAALTMPQEEKTKRMRKMRVIVSEQNVFRWAAKIISELLKMEFQEK